MPEIVEVPHGELTCPVCGEMKSDLSQTTCGDPDCVEHMRRVVEQQEVS